ncbi:MAG: translation elongation factor-like protein [Thermoplasmata archaeon]|nr:translation elongation factor-like protein [Thermoplasmata archaeon]
MNETPQDMPEMVKIGKIAHFFTNIDVAVIELSDELAVGDEIAIRGETSNFNQVVDSMEIDRVKIEKAGQGQSIGLKVKERVRKNDDVFKVVK